MLRNTRIYIYPLSLPSHHSSYRQGSPFRGRDWRKLFIFLTILIRVQMVEKEVVKALKLNVLPLSRRKGRLLSELFSSVLGCCNDILSIAKSANPENFAILHTTSYPVIKQKYSLHSQILVDCIHQVWENLNCKEFKRVPIRFNIPVLESLRNKAWKSCRCYCIV